MTQLRLLVIIPLIFLTTCCTPLIDLAETGKTFGVTGADLNPPVLGPAGAVDAYTFSLSFNEDLGAFHLENISPVMENPQVTFDGPDVTIYSATAQAPGIEYSLDIRATDSAGNSQQLIVRCYGYNPDIPGLLINEFTCQGSSTHPDMVELKVSEDGNLAGLAVVEGTDTNWDQRIILPECEVAAGDYILIHFKPQGIPEEIDETAAVDASEGLDSNPEARDFWVPEGSGLSGNNGVITVYTNPCGTLIDAVVYSNRTSSSDTDYRGFGSSSMLNKVDTVAEEGGWIGEEGILRPEDAVDPEDSTATRSICRSSASSDTGSSADWHIVPTSTASFGEINSDEVYSP